MIRRASAARFVAGPLLALGPLLAAGGGLDPSPPPLPAAPPPAPRAVVDRPLRDLEIAESSGLALSPTHDGLIWTVNDSGNPPVVYGIGPDGDTRVRLRVTGVPNIDWEAVAAWRDATGRALVAVADIGDNGAVRDGIEVDVFAEPTRLPAAPEADDTDDVPELEVRPLRRIRLRYPDQAKDAESLLVDPRSRRMYVVAKGLLRARVYLVPQSAWPGGATEPATLEFIGGLGLPLATDGAMLPTGYVVLRGYSTAMLVAPLPTEQRPLAPLAVIGLPRQVQGEGLAVTDTALYLSSEGRGSPILRLPMPDSFTAAISAGATDVGGTGSPVASPPGRRPLEGNGTEPLGAGAGDGEPIGIAAVLDHVVERVDTLLPGGRSVAIGLTGVLGGLGGVVGGVLALRVVRGRT